MEIKNAKYLISNADVRKCPEHDRPEYAFIGRSNVGKSSLINMLTKQGKLAKTSQKPGQTLLIKHIEINNGQWYLVDLPGYGYAQRGKDQRERFQKMIEGYILHRPQLVSLFVLIDIRHEPQKIDLAFLDWLGENQVPFAIVFTKADKLGPVAAERNVEDYKKVLLKSWEELPPIFITSAEKSKGREELLDYIGMLNTEVAANQRKEEEEEQTETVS